MEMEKFKRSQMLEDAAGAGERLGFEDEEQD